VLTDPDPRTHSLPGGRICRAPKEGSRTVADHDELLTPAEVAAMFRVNAKTVTRWSRSGKLRSMKTIGGHRRFYRSDIERAIARSQEQIDGP
jgi:excisionase family DNA binding protein